MTAAETRAWLLGLLAEIYRSRPPGGVLRWAKRNVFVPPEVSPEFPGMYDVRVTPLVDILFEFYDSPDYDEFIGCKSSQSGLSQGAHVCVLDYAVHVGKNIILSLDSRDEAKRVSQTRLQPMIKHCGALSTRVSENEDDWTNLTLMLKGLTVFLMGSHSPTALANKTAGLAICDEVDNYPERPKDESNAVDLLRDRIKKVMGSKLIAFSKPKNEDTIIWPEYLTGSRHKCFVPCPHCGHLQELVWEQVRFDHCKNVLAEWDYDRVLKETYYECANPECKKPIEESQKAWMIEHKEWRATNEGKDKWKPKPRKMSVHISDLYSLFPKDTWGHLATEWLDAQKSQSKLMSFFRGRLGLPWKEKRIEIATGDIRKMVGGYRRGQCPENPDIVLMASDVQKDVKKWVKTAWRLDDETCWVIDWGVTLTFEQLVSEADTPVEVLRWPEDVPKEKRTDPTVWKGLIDEGYDQPAVRDFVISTYIPGPAGALDYRFYPVFGRAGLQTVTWKDMFDVIRPNHKGWAITVYKINDDAFKQELYNNRIARYREVEAALKKGEDPPAVPRLWFPVGIDDEFVSELCQEARVWDEKRKKWVWREPPQANDFGDALKYNLCTWYILAPFLHKKRQAERARAAAVAAAAEKKKT